MGVHYGSGSGGGNSQAGRIVQVVNTDFAGSFYTNNTSMTTITGLTTNLTMHDSGNKVLVMINMGTAGIGGSNNFAYLRLYRDSDNFVGDAEGNRFRCSFSFRSGSDHIAHSEQFIYLDSPSTNAQVTYYVKVAAEGNYFRINQNGHGGNQTNYPQSRSSLTLMEIAA
tara:strand:- start:228 stop:731 length:504 start_codon:yes stop_codon:yes gene_type:complete